MPHFIYSSEALPNEKMIGKPGYTPDNECIKWAGLTLPVIQAGKWQEMPETLHTLRRGDWRDRQGQPVEVHIRRFKGIIDANFAKRGVVFIDHEPSATEKEKLEAVSKDLNLQWRRSVIQEYEDQVREKEVTGHGRTKPTPYEDECYEVLNMKKPYSVDALQSQRDPGQKAAQQIADAISTSQKELVAALKDAMKPEPAKVPAVRQ
jgi:hypothetical protein